jgi:peptidoglycan/xylan/chitin deacetylase (PgdA/CDA1 family)
MIGWKHHVFAAAFRAIDVTGAGWLARRWTGGLGAILMFHHVRPWREAAFAPNRLLEITPDYLALVLDRLDAAGFEIIPIDRLATRIRDANARRPFAVLTFDDGAVDIEQHALPILKRRNAPFTVFAVPGFADRSAPLWWLDLEDAIARMNVFAARLGSTEQRFAAASPREKQAAFSAVYRALRAGPEEALRGEIARLAALAGMNPLEHTARICLDWDGLRRLAAEPLCTIGAHSLTHPMLAKHGDAFAMNEMVGGKARLEGELQRDIRHFAYPVGDPGSAGERDFALAREAGFETAVTTRPGMIFSEHASRLTALPRLSVNGLHQSRAAIDALLTGLPFYLANRGQRAA